MKRHMTVINNSNTLPGIFSGVGIALFVRTFFISDYDYHAVIFWIKTFVCVALWGYSYSLKQK